MILAKTFEREDWYHLITAFSTGLFLIPQDYDSQCKKYITHFFLPLHPGNSPFPMRVFKKFTIGIISNHSLQHPSGYYFLCDSMFAGGLSGWNAELVSGESGLWPFLHSTQLLNELWLHLGVFLSLWHMSFIYLSWSVFLLLSSVVGFLYFTLSATFLWTP